MSVLAGVERIEAKSVTVPAGTTQVAPLETDVSFPPGEVIGVHIVIPAGPVGLSGIALMQAHRKVIPITVNEFIVSNDEKLYFPLEGFLNSGNWQTLTYNTDVNAHTYRLRFLIREVGSAEETGTVTVVPVPIG